MDPTKDHNLDNHPQRGGRSLALASVYPAVWSVEALPALTLRQSAYVLAEAATALAG